MDVSTSFAKVECMTTAIEQFKMRYAHKGFTPYWVESLGSKVWLWTFNCTDRNDVPYTITIDIHDMSQDTIKAD